MDNENMEFDEQTGQWSQPKKAGVGLLIGFVILCIIAIVYVALSMTLFSTTDAAGEKTYNWKFWTWSMSETPECAVSDWSQCAFDATKNMGSTTRTLLVNGKCTTESLPCCQEGMKLSAGQCVSNSTPNPNPNPNPTPNTTGLGIWYEYPESTPRDAEGLSGPGGSWLFGATLDDCQEECINTPGCSAIIHAEEESSVGGPGCYMKGVSPAGNITLGPAISNYTTYCLDSANCIPY